MSSIQKAAVVFSFSFIQGNPFITVLSVLKHSIKMRKVIVSVVLLHTDGDGMTMTG